MSMTPTLRGHIARVLELRLDYEASDITTVEAARMRSELAAEAPYLASRLEAVLDAGVDAFLDEVMTKDQQDRRCDTPGDAHARWEKVDGPLATKARAVKAALKKALEEE